MFQVTLDAAEKLKAALAERQQSEESCFRLGFAGHDVRIALDQPRPGDSAIQHDGQVILVVDPATSESLVDRELDVDENSSQLVLTRLA
jgi:hypothetical protein